MADKGSVSVTHSPDPCCRRRSILWHSSHSVTRPRTPFSNWQTRRSVACSSDVARGESFEGKIGPVDQRPHARPDPREARDGGRRWRARRVRQPEPARSRGHGGPGREQGVGQPASRSCCRRWAPTARRALVQHAAEGVHPRHLQVRPVPHRRGPQAADDAQDGSGSSPIPRPSPARSRPPRRPRRSRPRSSRGEAIAAAINHARDLVNEPAAVITPTALAHDAQAIAKKHKGTVTATILDAKKCAELGMGMFLAVGQGSGSGAGFIHMTYKPAKKPKKRVAFIGKGVTFDSGGYSLKPSQAMEDMKVDMSGRRGRDLGDGRDRDARLGPRGPRGRRVLREPGLRPRLQARRRPDLDGRHHGRDQQHRRRGPADPRRRDHLRPHEDPARRDVRLRDAHGRLHGRARTVHRRRDVRSRGAAQELDERRASGPARTCGACRSTVASASSSRARSRTCATPATGSAARSPRACSSRRSRKDTPVGPRRHRRPGVGRRAPGPAQPKGGTGFAVATIVEYATTR